VVGSFCDTFASQKDDIHGLCKRVASEIVTNNSLHSITLRCQFYIFLRNDNTQPRVWPVAFDPNYSSGASGSACCRLVKDQRVIACVEQARGFRKFMGHEIHARPALCREADAPTGSTASEYFSPVFSRHACTEAMVTLSLEYAGLESTLHCLTFRVVLLVRGREYR
jgi:hypothetical protein